MEKRVIAVFSMDEENLQNLENSKSIIKDCPECEDRDCKLNCEGLCHSLNTILNNIPGGMYTCSEAIIDFCREQ